MEDTKPVSAFDGKTISYTYENGWSFTNSFEGNLRISDVPRGILREQVEVAELRTGLYFISWIDDEMGLLAQIIDLDTNTVIAAIPVEGEQVTQHLRGELAKGI